MKSSHSIFWRNEYTLAALTVLALLAGSRLSSHFLDAGYLLGTTTLYVETGIMALLMTAIIICGHIDLSVASTLALTAAATGVLHAQYAVPFWLACCLGMLLAGMLGALNGVLIVGMNLPSLTVTLGTMALYRGAAQILIGDHSVGGFPAWFCGVDQVYAGPFPVTLLLLLAGGCAMALFLQRTTLGRCIYAIGNNKTASRLSGLRVGAVEALLFTLSGLAAGMCGLLMASRLSVARFDMASGKELDVITAVVLGGTDIFGGKGGVAGTLLALCLLALLRTGMGLADIPSEKQQIVVGALLIGAIALPRLAELARKQYMKRQKPAAAG